MPIQAILFDAGGVLYHRPREDNHLSAFLEPHDLKLRHRKVVDRALRAARFDVQSGRISREMFYDAILRVHGVEDAALFPEGRAALLRDAADIELYPGVEETLHRLYEAGYRLGVVSDSAHPTREKLDWLVARGLPLALWDVFLVSCEQRQLKAEGALFEHALTQLMLDWDEVAFVGHDTSELARAAELGMTTIAFMPDDPATETEYVITSFYGLQDLFLG